MARRTKEEAQQTRAKLIDAAEIVFHRTGVAQASLNEIAQEANLTRGAFYWHFKNKQDIFKAMLDRQSVQLGQLGLTMDEPGDADPLALLRASILFVVREIERDPSRRRVYEIVFQKCEMTAQNEPIGTLLRNNVLIGSERMHAAFTSAIRQNYMPKNLDIDSAITHLHVQVTGVVYLWLLLPGTFDLQSQATRLIDLFFSQLPEHFLSGEV
ncbi:TetR family transcriptional regulator [Marinobacter sp.]|uniref:TetR family transcriptional regulator n=1 Tax=Marinobacter sp. TaxID=50741 RepID=UPI001B7579AB|nr:TetR family transcriptional regulator [Marinobacter sp.]MBQ0831957.1 TetR family transcriptional regulator [Marinobacter sp.]